MGVTPPVVNDIILFQENKSCFQVLFQGTKKVDFEKINIIRTILTLPADSKKTATEQMNESFYLMLTKNTYSISSSYNRGYTQKQSPRDVL